jgi:heme/copper-type cytochrome/quinol oxidase subunit 2
MENQNGVQSYGVVKNQSVVSILDWILTFLIMVLPIVNIVMLFVWAFGGNAPESKANWAKARLLMCLIGVILVVFFGSIFAAAIMSALGNLM